MIETASVTPTPWYRAVPGASPLVLIVSGSRLFEVDTALYEGLRRADAAAESELSSCVHEPRGAPPPIAMREPNAISLNIAQACNLACHYCYADEGRFGGSARLMQLDVALRIVDEFIDAAPGPRVTIGFIGGEPLVNRGVLRACVERATARAAERGVAVNFSVTTNGTMIDGADVELFRAHPFAVTVSLDGPAAMHDKHRPARNGAGSFDRALACVTPLLRHPGSARVSARATVTRDNVDVATRVAGLVGAGFAEAGVSPLRTGPRPELALRESDWDAFLASMIRAADEDWRGALAGRPLHFSNFAQALNEIHRGACRALPCGSAVNYVSASAEGKYYTCHRTIDDERFELGRLGDGIDSEKRSAFVASRAVDSQEPCRSCWARYLCGGGCHAEVILEGRHGCGYIRGWLEYCLQRYHEALAAAPHLFAPHGAA